MNKIANAMIDFHDDNSCEVLRAISIPEEYKSAEIKKKEEYTKFALDLISNGQSLSKFPIDDPAITWISMNYFDKTASKLPIVARQIAAQFINDACEKFDIEPSESVKIASVMIDHEFDYNTYDCSKAESDNIKYASNEPKKIEPQVEFSKYALEYEDRSGNAVKRFPIDTDKQVKLASNWFEDNYRKLTPDERFKMAKNLVDVGTTSKTAKKYYGTTIKNNKMVKMAFDLRLEQLEDEEHIGCLLELAEKRAELHPHVMAQALSRFDKMAGLDAFWDTLIPDPYQSILEPEKVAEFANYEGDDITEKDIREIPNKKLSMYFDSETIKGLKENPIQMFKTLADDSKELVFTLAKGC